jgi:hypothetical protein
VELVTEVEDDEDDEDDEDELVLLTPNDANAFSMACIKFEPLFVTLLVPPSSLSESFFLLERTLDMDCKFDKALVLDVLLIADMKAS